MNSNNEETNDTIYIIDCYGNCLDQFQTKDEIIVNYPSQVIVTPTLYPSSIIYSTSSYQSVSIELKDSKTQELVKTLNYNYRLETDRYKVYKENEAIEEELNKLYEKEAYQDENGTIIAYTTVQDGLLTLYDENNNIKNRFNLKNNYFYGSKKLVFSDKIIYYYSTLVSEKAQLVEHENPDTGLTEKQTEYVLDFDNSDYTSILIVNLKDYTITYNGNFDYYISNAKKCGENYLVSFYSLGEDGLFEQTKKQVIMKDEFIFENVKEEIINNVIKLDDNHLVVEMNEDQDQYYLVSKENRVLIKSDNTSSSIEVLDANTLLIHYQNKMFEVDIKKLIEASGDYEFALGYTYISKEIYGEERLHIYNIDSSYFIGQNKIEEKYLDYLKQNIIVSKDKVIIGGEIVYQVSTFDSISSFDKIYGLGNHFVYQISTVNGDIKYVYVIKSKSVLE